MKMKKIMAAGMAMAAIIVVRTALSYLYTEQAAEVFTRVSLSALFYYWVIRGMQSRKNKKLCGKTR